MIFIQESIPLSIKKVFHMYIGRAIKIQGVRWGVVNENVLQVSGMNMTLKKQIEIIVSSSFSGPTSIVLLTVEIYCYSLKVYSSLTLCNNRKILLEGIQKYILVMNSVCCVDTLLELNWHQLDDNPRNLVTTSYKTTPTRCCYCISDFLKISELYVNTVWDTLITFILHSMFFSQVNIIVR